MTVAASVRPVRFPEERIQARDAYGNAITLALLLLAWGTLGLVFTPILPLWPVKAGWIFQMSLARPFPPRSIPPESSLRQLCPELFEAEAHP